VKVSCVAESTAVGRASKPSNKTVEVVLNPAPPTVKVADVSPAGTEEGFSDVMVCPGARWGRATAKQITLMSLASHRNVQSFCMVAASQIHSKSNPLGFFFSAKSFLALASSPR
jgi:hypothetical protein